MRQGRKFGSNWSCYYFLFQKKIVKLLCNIMYSPSHRQARDPVTNIQSTLRTTPNLCKNVSLAVLFGSNGNSCTFFIISQLCVCVCVCVCVSVCVCVHTFCTIQGSLSDKRIKKELGQQCMPQAKEIFLRAILDTRAIGLPALLQNIITLITLCYYVYLKK